MARVTVSLDKEQTDKAKAVIRMAFETGKNGTVGDHSDAGFLYYLLEALDCDFGKPTGPTMRS